MVEELTRKLHYTLKTFNCHCQDDFVENLVTTVTIVKYCLSRLLKEPKIVDI